MGVTLERVQEKFAFIIEELCSEPVVLSQFVIWLDLRLAEYKAKGVISLDCSGDDPDPEWMNGHRLPNQKSSPQDRQSQPGRYCTSTTVSTPPGEQDIHRANSDQSTNQSLMSIISGGIAEHPIETVYLTESDINIIKEYENKEGVSHHRDPSNSRPSFSSPPAAASGSSEYSARSDDILNAEPTQETRVTIKRKAKP